MEDKSGKTISVATLATIVGICFAVFAAASAVAANGYSERMWSLVVAGLVLPPVVGVASVAVALVGRFSRG